METENTNGKPAAPAENYVWSEMKTAAELKVVQQKLDAQVLALVKSGHSNRNVITVHANIDDRTADNALRRLKKAGKVVFLGAKAEQGWRVAKAADLAVPKASAKKAAAKKPKRTRRKVLAKAKASKTARSGRSNVHCFLPSNLVRHVKKQLKPGETFTDAVQNGLTKKYGSP